MAWENANDLVVGSGGELSVAASGTAVPTSTTGALNAAFAGLGYLDEDGATLTVTPNIQEFNVWQSRQPGRREALAQEILLAGKAAQFSETTVPTAFGGGSISGTSPNYSYAFPADTTTLQEVAVVLDVTDGSEHHRFAFGRANQTEATEVQFNRANLAVLPLGLKVLAPAAGGSPGAYYTDSAAFAGGS